MLTKPITSTFIPAFIPPSPDRPSVVNEAVVQVPAKDVWVRAEAYLGGQWVNIDDGTGALQELPGSGSQLLMYRAAGTQTRIITIFTPGYEYTTTDVVYTPVVYGSPGNPNQPDYDETRMVDGELWGWVFTGGTNVNHGYQWMSLS